MRGSLFTRAHSDAKKYMTGKKRYEKDLEATAEARHKSRRHGCSHIEQWQPCKFSTSARTAVDAFTRA